MVSGNFSLYLVNVESTVSSQGFTAHVLLGIAEIIH